MSKNLKLREDTKKMSGVMLYRNYISTFSLLGDEEVGKVVKSVANYFLYGTEPHLPGALQNIAEDILFGLDKDIDRYGQR